MSLETLGSIEEEERLKHTIYPSNLTFSLIAFPRKSSNLSREPTQLSAFVLSPSFQENGTRKRDVQLHQGMALGVRRPELLLRDRQDRPQRRAKIRRRPPGRRPLPRPPSRPLLHAPRRQLGLLHRLARQLQAPALRLRPGPSGLRRLHLCPSVHRPGLLAHQDPTRPVTGNSLKKPRKHRPNSEWAGQTRPTSSKAPKGPQIAHQLRHQDPAFSDHAPHL